MDNLRILHYVYDRLFRVHITFNDVVINGCQITNYFMYPEFRKNKLNFIKSYMDNVNSKNKFVFFRKKSDADDKLKQILKNTKPHIVIASTFLPLDLMKILKEHKIKLYFINHGIYNDYSGKYFSDMRNSGVFLKEWHMFDGYFLTPTEPKVFTDIGVSPEKIYINNGMPPMDYMFKINMNERRKLIMSHTSSKDGKLEQNCKFPLNPNKKSILYIQNVDGIIRFGKQSEKLPLAHDEYADVLEHLSILSEKMDFHIYTKIKKNTDTKLKHRPIISHNNITFVDFNDRYLLYDFLFCDIIIIQTCSTAFIEALLINPKVIQCQILEHVNFIKVNEYGMLKADNFNQLTDLIDNLLNSSDKVITNEYLKKRDDYIKYYLNNVNKNTTKSIYEKLIELNGTK